MRKLLILLMLFPAIILAQNGTVIEPKINAQTIQGSDTTDFVRTQNDYKLFGTGTVGQVLQATASGALGFATNSSDLSIKQIDSRNPSKWVLTLGNDSTVNISTSHPHAELLSVYGGTITGNLTVTGLITGSVNNPKAYAYLDSNAVALSITQNVWTPVTGFTLGAHENGISFSNDTITVTTAGTYKLNFDPAVAKAAGSSAYVEIGFSISGADPLSEHKTGRQFTSADVGFGMLSRTVVLSANDYIVIKTRNSTNGDNLTFRYGEFSVIKD